MAIPSIFNVTNFQIWMEITLFAESPHSFIINKKNVAHDIRFSCLGQRLRLKRPWIQTNGTLCMLIQRRDTSYRFFLGNRTSTKVKFSGLKQDALTERKSSPSIPSLWLFEEFWLLQRLQFWLVVNPLIEQRRRPHWKKFRVEKLCLPFVMTNHLRRPWRKYFNAVCFRPSEVHRRCFVTHMHMAGSRRSRMVVKYSRTFNCHLFLVRKKRSLLVVWLWPRTMAVNG